MDQPAQLKLSEALRVSEVMRRLLLTMLRALIYAEGTAHIGVGPRERTDSRTTQRDGTREKLVATTGGDLTVKILKLRAGPSLPSLPGRRRRIVQVLFAVGMEVSARVSTRKVDNVTKALGADSRSPSPRCPRICAELEEEVAAFRDRSLAETAFPYAFLDANYCKARRV